MVKSHKGNSLAASVRYADNAKILRTHHKNTWDTLHRYFRELLLETMYVPLSNTPELNESWPTPTIGIESGPESLVSFNVRSNGWIYWGSALKHRVINDAVGYVPPSQTYPDSNVFVPLPESWVDAAGNRTIDIFPDTGVDMAAIELLDLWNTAYEQFFPLHQHELIAPEIYYYLTKAIRAQRDQKRQGSDADELAIGLTSKIAGSRSIADSQKMARTILNIGEKQLLHIPPLINKGVWY